MMKLVPLIIFLAIIPSLSVCRPESGTPNTVSFEELINNPLSYAGEPVCTEGVYLDGFEVSALGADTYQQSGVIYLTEPVIWLEGAEIVVKGECDAFQGFQFCPAVSCGTFEFGDRYGHLDGYVYQNKASK